MAAQIPVGRAAAVWTVAPRIRGPSACRACDLMVAHSFWKICDLLNWCYNNKHSVTLSGKFLFLAYTYVN